MLRQLASVRNNANAVGFKPGLGWFDKAADKLDFGGIGGNTASTRLSRVEVGTKFLKHFGRIRKLAKVHDLPQQIFAQVFQPALQISIGGQFAAGTAGPLDAHPPLHGAGFKQAHVAQHLVHARQARSPNGGADRATYIGR